MSKTFAHWLRAQTRRDDPIGDLARDVTGDVRSGCLTRITSRDALFRHIAYQHAGEPHVLATVDAAEHEWLASTMNPRPGVEGPTRKATT